MSVVEKAMKFLRNLEKLVADLTVFLAAHNEESILANSLEKLYLNREKFRIRNVVICENGSSDRTTEVCSELQSQYGSEFVTVSSIAVGDLGMAFRAGVDKYIDGAPYSDDKFLLFTASDLPFGFTDISNFWMQDLSKLDFIIGSKGHPMSELDRTFLRSSLSFFFWFLRIVILGVSVKDTQGTLFIRQRCLIDVLNASRCNGFLFTTELVYLAIRKGYKVVEIPVVYSGEVRKSKVRVLTTSWRLLNGIMKMRLTKYV